LSPSPGGVGRYAAKLAGGLASLGAEVRAVVARHSDEQVRKAWQEAGLSGAVPLPRVMPLARPVLYDCWHLFGWPQVGKGADVVHAPSLAVPPKGGQPLVVSIHDAGPWIWPEAFGFRGRWFHATGARAAARRADLVLTGTQAAADELVKYLRLPSERLRVVPYGADPPTAPDPGTLRRYGLEGRPYVLWVGSLEPRKGVTTLVEALARLPDAHRPLLVLAGYQGWKMPAPTGPGVVRLGKVTDPELQALYAGAVAFCFPSRHEGFGLPVVEAMAAGVPVVASDIPAIREVAGGAAQLVPPGDAARWAEAVQAAICLSPAERERVVEAGRRRAGEFTWTATAARTLEVYRQLV